MPTVHENLIGVQDRQAVSTRDDDNGVSGFDDYVMSGFLLLESGCSILKEDGCPLQQECAP